MNTPEPTIDPDRFTAAARALHSAAPPDQAGLRRTRQEVVRRLALGESAEHITAALLDRGRPVMASAGLDEHDPCHNAWVA
jgi:hypothetical protein